MDTTDADESFHSIHNSWKTLPPSLISQNVWLPLDASNETVNELLNYLTLAEYMMCLPLEKASLRQRKYYGFICTSKTPIYLTELSISHDHLYAKKIENSDLTVDLLNIRICRKTRAPENTIMENYLSSLFGSNSDTELTHHLKASIPIAFAHNVVARKYAPNLETLISKEENVMGKEHIYSFVASLMENTAAESSSSESDERVEEAENTAKKYEFFYVSPTGKLVKVEELLCKTTDEFSAILHKLGATQILALFKNKIGQLRREIETEKQNLTVLDPDRSNCLFVDESLTDEDLKEMSALSEEIDNAEDFKLFIEDANDFKTFNSNEKSSNLKEVRRIEKKIRQLASKISAARKELYDDQKDYNFATEESFASHKDIYSTKEYARFSDFYRHNVLENAVMTPSSSLKKSLNASRLGNSSAVIDRICTSSQKRKSKNDENADEVTTKQRRFSTRVLREQNDALKRRTKSKSDNMFEAQKNNEQNIKTKSYEKAASKNKRSTNCKK